MDDEHDDPQNDAQHLHFDDDDDDEEEEDDDAQDEHHHHDDEEDDDEDEHNDHVRGGPRRNPDGTVDGGVAVPMSEAVQREAADCDLILCLECVEPIHVAPDHPMMQPGVRVAIGLDKSTKLSAVFSRYCDFLHEQDHHYVRIVPSQLEFYHCSVLNAGDTAEVSALMKHDLIQVRNPKTDEREKEAEEKRMQREMDRDYFKALRGLLNVDTSKCDVMLDCRGSQVDETGRSQQVLQTGVKAHSVLVSARCPWLARKIQTAREELERKSVVTLPDQAEDVEGEDVSIEDVPPQNAVAVGAAEAEIKSDDSNDDEQSNRPDSPNMADASSLLWVTLTNHPPSAVRLLLEYIYTNRCVPLGQEAFMSACKTQTNEGPVPPFNNHSSRSRGWPKKGRPDITFHEAVAGIVLAEEAQIPRFSLMCEVAASQLLDASNVVEALTLCTSQQQSTNNSLPRLRSAAISKLLHHGERGVEELTKTPTFDRALREKSGLVIPSLLMGTMEAVKEESKKRRAPSYLDIDFRDKAERRSERRKWRKKRRKTGGSDLVGGEREEGDAMDPDLGPHFSRGTKQVPTRKTVIEGRKKKSRRKRDSAAREAFAYLRRQI